VDPLQHLNSVVQSGHHLHLELEELLRSQRWRHRQRLVGTLVVLPLRAKTGAGALGVHHLFAADEIYKIQILYNSGKKTLAG
jgi:hypothetical protein